MSVTDRLCKPSLPDDFKVKTALHWKLSATVFVLPLSLFSSIILIQSKVYNAQENRTVSFYKWELLQNFANGFLFLVSICFLFLNLHCRLHGFHFSCVWPFKRAIKLQMALAKYVQLIVGCIFLRDYEHICVKSTCRMMLVQSSFYHIPWIPCWE